MHLSLTSSSCCLIWDSCSTVSSSRATCCCEAMLAETLLIRARPECAPESPTVVIQYTVVAMAEAAKCYHCTLRQIRECLRAEQYLIGHDDLHSVPLDYLCTCPPTEDADHVQLSKSEGCRLLLSSCQLGSQCSPMFNASAGELTASLNTW